MQAGVDQQRRTFFSDNCGDGRFWPVVASLDAALRFCRGLLGVAPFAAGFACNGRRVPLKLRQFELESFMRRTKIKRSRFTEEQVIAILREREAGAKTADVCCEHGVSSATF